MHQNHKNETRLNNIMTISDNVQLLYTMQVKVKLWCLSKVFCQILFETHEWIAHNFRAVQCADPAIWESLQLGDSYPASNDI